MPSRHISPQSFDEILSELGDDPAIPDPHGIRKTSAPKTAHQQPENPSKVRQPLDALSALTAGPQVQKLGPFIGIGLCLIGLSLALFIAFESIESRSESLIQGSQNQISALQKELGLLRTELQNIEDNLYEEIDLLEVSIHSLKENKPLFKGNPKPQPTPHESELKNWRFLGTAQIRGSHQAFFHTGKKNGAFQKGALVLGDWCLTQIEKEFVTLTHPLGKTFVLKSSNPNLSGP